MLAARILYNDEEFKNIIVSCPYCFKGHKHGYDTVEELNNMYRSSHCCSGDYKIEGSYDFKIVNFALHQREQSVKFKRKYREQTKAKLKELEAIKNTLSS